MIGNISDNSGVITTAFIRGQQGDTICMDCWDNITNGHFTTNYIGSQIDTTALHSE